MAKTDNQTNNTTQHRKLSCTNPDKTYKVSLVFIFISCITYFDDEYHLKSTHL